MGANRSDTATVRLTVEEILQAVDDLKPNSFSREDKVAWLRAFDGQIRRELVATHRGGEDLPSPEQGQEDRFLLVPEPYGRDLYLTYLENRMDHYNGDTGRYNNSLDQLSGAYTAFARWYHRTHLPLGGSRKFW